MKFTTKVRYGMRAMVEIAKVDQKIGILQKDISERQKISIKYLDHIIKSLKNAKLIANIKGKKSGYKITRSSSEITLFEIHSAFENEIAVIDCLRDCVSCEMEQTCLTFPFWTGLNNLVVEYFSNATLEDLVNKREF
ncbi:MAG: Rrf2 family transcriptional regulator [Bacteroidetes bacterium]|nr:Rrf2 family transcriptional regulator [Bacteroidota bacterium]